jgi:hypothetical protein
MRKTGLAMVTVAGVLTYSFSGAEAKSCTDVLNSCMKMYSNQARGHGTPTDPEAVCRNDFNGCMQTGTWAGQTVTIKGLEKK